MTALRPTLESCLIAGIFSTRAVGGSDEAFLDRVFRATEDEADGVMGKIRRSVDTTRFSAYTSLRHGVLTAQRGDKFCLLPPHLARARKIIHLQSTKWGFRGVEHIFPFASKVCVIVSKHRNAEKQSRRRRWEEAVRCSRSKNQYRRTRASCSGRIHFYGASELADRILMWTQRLAL